MFSRKGVLKIRSKFTGEHLFQCDFNKVACNFFEIALRHGCSPAKLLDIFRTSFPENTSGWLFLMLPLHIVTCCKGAIVIGPASARSYKIGVVDNKWLVGWLVGNAVLSEKNGFKDFSDFLHEVWGL